MPGLEAILLGAGILPQAFQGGVRRCTLRARRCCWQRWFKRRPERWSVSGSLPSSSWEWDKVLLERDVRRRRFIPIHFLGRIIDRLDGSSAMKTVSLFRRRRNGRWGVHAFDLQAFPMTTRRLGRVGLYS